MSYVPFTFLICAVPMLDPTRYQKQAIMCAAKTIEPKVIMRPRYLRRQWTQPVRRQWNSSQ